LTAGDGSVLPAPVTALRLPVGRCYNSAFVGCHFRSTGFYPPATDWHL